VKGGGRQPGAEGRQILGAKSLLYASASFWLPDSLAWSQKLNVEVS
jgi:hypothetical protein